MTSARILAVLAIALASVSASAQSFDKCQLLYGGGHQGWGACGTGTQNQQQQQQQQQQFVGAAQPFFNNGPGFGNQVAFVNAPATVVSTQRAIPSNCELVEKTVWQRLGGGAKEALIDGLIGGLAGAAADRIGRTGGRWTNVGLTAGVAYGAMQGSADQYTMVCHTAAAPAVAMQQQGVTSPSQQGGTRHTCPVGDAVIDVAPTQDCRNLDAAVRAVGGRTYNGSAMPPMGGQPTQAQQQPQSQATGAVFTPRSEGVPASIPQTCRIGTEEGMYRFNLVDGRKITPSDCDEYKRKQKPLPAKDRLAIG